MISSREWLYSVVTERLVYIPRDRKCPMFRGKSGIGINEWVEEVQACMRARYLSPADQAFFLFDHLEGEAREEIKYRSSAERGDPDKHLARLELVLERLQQEGLKAKLEKCAFFKPEGFQVADPVIREAFVFLRRKEPPSLEERKCLPQPALVLLRQWDRLVEKNGLLYRRIWWPDGHEEVLQLVLPALLKEDVLRQLHQEHGHQEPQLPVDFLLGRVCEPVAGTVNDWVLDHQTQLQIAFEGAREHLFAAASRRKERYDQHVRDLPLEEAQIQGWTSGGQEEQISEVILQQEQEDRESSVEGDLYVWVSDNPQGDGDLQGEIPVVAGTAAAVPVLVQPVREAPRVMTEFTYRCNHFTDDAITYLLHTTLSHLDAERGNYVKMLFVDYSSAFNTIIPSTLTVKLEDLGLHSSLCRWISNFLTDRTQTVRVGKHVSPTLTLSTSAPPEVKTGAPQGCVLSPFLYSLYTYDCVATSSSTTIVKFADDTVVLGLISNNDERAYLEEMKHLEVWCQDNNLLLNVNKTKELIVDCSIKQERNYHPVVIDGNAVERVDSFKYLGVPISEDLSWSCHTTALVKKAQQRLYHLRRLRSFKLPSKVLRNFHTCTIESILMGNITVWFGNSTMQDRQALQR
ncbi:hypothetical protein NFI96_009239, partial [Prochilodus magdalenae]